MKIKTNKILTLLFVALVITTTAIGQQRGGQRGSQLGPPPAPTTKQIVKMVDKISSEISLSGEQKVKVLEIYKTHFKEVESKTTSGRPDRTQMENLKDNFENEVKAVLTKEQ